MESGKDISANYKNVGREEEEWLVRER